MPKAQAVPLGTTASKHQNALEDDILATGPLRERTKTKKRKSLREDDAEGYIDSKSSRKILKIGQELAAEDEEEARKPLEDASNTAFDFDSRFAREQEEDEEENTFNDDDSWADENDEVVEEVEVDPKDLDMFNKFLPPTGEQPRLDLSEQPATEQKGKNLADIILEQIALHEAAQEGKAEGMDEDGPPQNAIEIDDRVAEVYTKVGMILSRYKSGKLPKPFKILPTLPHWEDLLAITRPETWTMNACYEATRIFVSSNPKVVRRFIETVLLDKVREDIHESKKLNVHLYNALKKATYKPAAFFKGFLFPLVGSGTCTLREAQIVSSVISRCSIPPLHSSAALMGLTDIAAEQASQSSEVGGATNIFIRSFLEKGYALPYKVIDNLVFHFIRFKGAPASADAMDTGGSALKDHKLPVLWHQSLLAFAQRYRNDITEDQREALLDLIMVKGHKDIGPEVRRELLEGRGRGVVLEENKSIIGGDDTMLVDPV